MWIPLALPPEGNSRQLKTFSQRLLGPKVMESAPMMS
jgi:hypothetical protein